MAEICALTENDSQAFFQLRLEGLKEASSAFGGSYEDEVAAGPARYQAILKKQEKQNVIFGAFVEGALVGCVGIFQEPSSKAKHGAKIWGMFVKTSVQGQGLGRKLVQRAIDHAKSIEGIQLINLSCESNNQSAKGLYQSFGFKTWGVEPKAIFEDGRFYDEDHMILLF